MESESSPPKRMNLLLACNLGDTEFVQDLFSKCSKKQLTEKLQVKDNHAYTAYHHAAAQNHVDILEVLLTAPPRAAQILRENYEGETCLFVACKNKVVDLRIVEMLLKYDKTLVEYVNNEHKSVFHVAVSTKRVDVLEKLVECAPHAINMRDVDEDTCLHAAAFELDYSVISYLLHWTLVDPHARNSYRRTAFDLACAANCRNDERHSNANNEISLGLVELFNATYDTLDEMFIEYDQYNLWPVYNFQLAIFRSFYLDSSNEEAYFAQKYFDEIRSHDMACTEVECAFMLHHKVIDCNRFSNSEGFAVFVENLLKVSLDFFYETIAHLCSKRFSVYESSAILFEYFDSKSLRKVYDTSKLPWVIYKAVEFLYLMGLDLKFERFQRRPPDELLLDAVMIFRTTYLKNDNFCSILKSYIRPFVRPDYVPSLKELARSSVRIILFKKMKMPTVEAALPYLAGVPKLIQNYIRFNHDGFQ